MKVRNFTECSFSLVEVLCACAVQNLCGQSSPRRAAGLPHTARTVEVLCGQRGESHPRPESSLIQFGKIAHEAMTI